MSALPLSLKTDIFPEEREREFNAPRDSEVVGSVATHWGKMYQNCLYLFSESHKLTQRDFLHFPWLCHEARQGRPQLSLGVWGCPYCIAVQVALYPIFDWRGTLPAIVDCIPPRGPVKSSTAKCRGIFHTDEMQTLQHGVSCSWSLCKISGTC